MDQEPQIRRRLPAAVTAAAAAIMLAASGCASGEGDANNAPQPSPVSTPVETTPDFDPSSVIPPAPSLSPEDRASVQAGIENIPTTQAYLDSPERNKQIGETVDATARRIINACADADIKPEAEKTIIPSESDQRIKYLAYRIGGKDSAIVRIMGPELPNGRLDTANTTTLSLIDNTYGIASYAREPGQAGTDTWTIAYKTDDMPETVQLGPGRTLGYTTTEVRRLQGQVSAAFSALLDTIPRS